MHLNYVYVYLFVFSFLSLVNSELVDGAAKTDTAAHRLFTLCDVEPRQEESQPMMVLLLPTGIY